MHNLFSEELGTICNFSSYCSAKVNPAVSLFDPISDDVYFIYKLHININMSIQIKAIVKSVIYENNNDYFLHSYS